MSGYALAIHGGAGSFRADPARAQALRESLRACLAQGASALADGASALDVVERAVRALEADPLFNAGTGAVLTADGEAELDASIMDGRTRRVGAVACVRRLAHPVSAARLVMERTPHVLLVGEGAERFALVAGAEEIAPQALVTALRRSQLARAQRESRKPNESKFAGDSRTLRAR